jgi:phytoene dehydrogenase-like protein
MNYDSIIIGAGLGGLIAAAKLTKAGQKVLVLEQHYLVGGCATTFQRKKFTMEVGLHELDGFGENSFKKKIFDELGVFDEVEFVRLPEFYRTLWKNTDFVFPENHEEAKARLKDEFPEETAAIEKYFRFVFGLGKEIDNLPRTKMQKRIKEPLFPLFYPKLVRSTLNTAGGFMDKLFHDKRLKMILLSNASYYHDDPHDLSLFYFAAGQNSYYSNGGYFIKGGSQKLSDYLMNYIRRQGGEVLLRKEVTSIITENGNAVGVSYRDEKKKGAAEKQVYANQIIANAAVPQVAQKLLQGEEALRLQEKTANMKPGPSILTVYLGFKKPPKEIGNKVYSTFVIDESVQDTKDILANAHAGFDKRSFVFVDYGMIDSGLAPEGKATGSVCVMDYAADWKNLDKKAYEQKKEEAARILISRLDKVIPGIEKIIEYQEVGTPLTIEHYTFNTDGTPYGYAQSLNQTARKRLPVKSIIPGLYFASAWSSPGGGFTGAILSGYTCALRVLHDAKEKA